MRCLYPDCPNTSRTRGACASHYATLRDRVRKGLVTEADLEARGLITAKGTGGTPARDDLSAFRIGSEIIGRGHADYQEPEHCAQGFHPSLAIESSLEDGGVTRATCDDCGDVVLAAKGARFQLPVPVAR